MDRWISIRLTQHPRGVSAEEIVAIHLPPLEFGHESDLSIDPLFRIAISRNSLLERDVVHLHLQPPSWNVM